MRDSLYENWVQRWQASLDACQRLGGEVSMQLLIMPPADEVAVAEVEAQIGMALPSSFRTILLEFSSHVEAQWRLPDDADCPDGFGGIFCGGPFWDLSLVPRFEARRISWVTNCFSDIEDAYDNVWHSKLAFDKVANGDQLAFDSKFMPDAPVVYLSHDGGEGHGFRLGSSFTDFMERWSLLGCPGNEDWQMMPFLPDATGGLDPYGENARKWREWFGLDFEVNKQ